jgi:hypothetical protein
LAIAALQVLGDPAEYQQQLVGQFAQNEHQLIFIVDSKDPLNPPGADTQDPCLHCRQQDFDLLVDYVQLDPSIVQPPQLKLLTLVLQPQSFVALLPIFQVESPRFGSVDLAVRAIVLADSRLRSGDPVDVVDEDWMAPPVSGMACCAWKSLQTRALIQTPLDALPLMASRACHAAGVMLTERTSTVEPFPEPSGRPALDRWSLCDMMAQLKPKPKARQDLTDQQVTTWALAGGIQFAGGIQ